MYREPYYDHYPKMKELSFEQFIKFSIEDYENPITMWNYKNESYAKMAAELPHSIMINVEDFHASQENIHERLSKILGMTDAPFVPMNSYVNGRGRHDETDISASLQVPTLDSSIIESINAFLSMETVEKYNYKKL